MTTGSSGEGNVFSVGVNGSGFRNLLSFSGTSGAYLGAYPYGSLTLSGTTLYGMTDSGGSSGDGNLFSVGINGSGYRNLLNFSGVNGWGPIGSLTLSGTTLYGMTENGGSGGLGNVFSIGTNGSGFRNLFSFSGPNGWAPCGSLTLSGTTLYGMTGNGGSTYGSLYAGNVFSIGTNGGAFRNLLSFSGIRGAYPGAIPTGSLTLSGTTLYGMTSEQQGTVGGGGLGNVFSIGIDGSGYQNLYSFSGGDGFAPYGSLILSGTTLYGMTSGGGSSGEGNVFSIGVDGSGFQNLLGFSGTGGAYPGNEPLGDLTLSGSTLYGMTLAGGANDDGTAFSLTMTTPGPSAPAPSWASLSSGSWSNSANWIGGVPNGAGDGAVFNLPTASAITVTLDMPVTIGSLQFANSGIGNLGYTLTGSGGNTLTFNNSGSGATITVIDGSHAINAPVILADNLVVTSGGTSAWRLSFGPASSITDNGAGHSLTMSGTGGTLILSGSNSYSGGTIVEAGTLEVTTPAALLDGTNLTVGNPGAFVVVKGVWASASGGNWSDKNNWVSQLVPNGAGQVAIIDSPTTTPVNITLDSPQTVGVLQLGNSLSNMTGYTLAGAGSGTALTLNNNGAGTIIDVSDGRHAIDAAVLLTDNLTVTSESGNPWTLTFGTATYLGESGHRRLTLNAANGTLVLSGTGGYTGGTFVAAGTLIVEDAAAIEDGTDLSVGNAARFAGPLVPSSGTSPAEAASPVPEPSTLAVLAVATAFVRHRIGRRRKARRRGE
jgi:autotransporter-associated beta strand protein/uncharacterized repeat protein (TIGR03803 family)